MKALLISTALMIMAVSAVFADDLYEVRPGSPADAALLRDTGVEPLLRLPDGYLILTTQRQDEALMTSGVEMRQIAAGISRDQIAWDGRLDRVSAERFPVLWENGLLRLLFVEDGFESLAGQKTLVFPLRESRVEIEYSPPTTPDFDVLRDAGRDSVVALISQDSIEANLLRLEAFHRRLTGTDSSWAARDWIEGKFRSYGYDSVIIDPFTGSQLWDYHLVNSYNVIAVKPGYAFPEQQIIIGAHFDAVPDCPGADDNGSGTATVLEIARVLADIDLPMTFIFITFDSEESWMWGSYHYCDEAVARGDDIVLMVNPDMIGHYDNDDFANLYYGDDLTYANLWSGLSTDYGINGWLSGYAASDHLPFQEAGYDVIFVQEGNFSTHYHQPSDSSVYMNFEYMTRMVKATLATMYTVGNAPPPVRLAALQEPGDGQSKLVHWHPLNPSAIDHYRLYYCRSYYVGCSQYIEVPATDTSCLVTGLTEGLEYRFYVKPFDADGHSAYKYDVLVGTPWVDPRPPENLFALPGNHAVNLYWAPNNVELDFDYYAIIRDGTEVGTCTDSFYVDDDPSLGSAYHDYLVVAVDLDGNRSDTVGMQSFTMKAGDLDPDRMLAVNRSGSVVAYLVDEFETGALMREALEGHDYDYYSDSVLSDSTNLRLIDMVDYGLIIVGDETGRYDKIGCAAEDGGILDTLDYYLSIGGKVIVFSRWGDDKGISQIDYDPGNAYRDCFHIDYRMVTQTTVGSGSLTCDLVGAHSVVADYPELVWDSAATANHSSPFSNVTGVPFVSWTGFTSGGAQVIYTYNSGTDDPFSEGRPVAWRYLGADYRYVFFDIPLSFFDRPTAVAALQQAITDLTGGNPECCVIRGDIDHDGAETIDIADLTYLIHYMFLSGPPPPCYDEGNIDGEGPAEIDIADLVYLIDYMFRSGPPPVSCP